MEELEALAAEAGARWDTLKGQTLLGKTGALVEWAERNNKLLTLMYAVIRARPDSREDWE